VTLRRKALTLTVAAAQTSVSVSAQGPLAGGVSSRGARVYGVYVDDTDQMGGGASFTVEEQDSEGNPVQPIFQVLPTNISKGFYPVGSVTTYDSNGDSYTSTTAALAPLVLTTGYLGATLADAAAEDILILTVYYETAGDYRF
jgi:hypothetical protein